MRVNVIKRNQLRETLRRFYLRGRLSSEVDSENGEPSAEALARAEEARRVEEEARAQIEVLRKEAFEQGYQKGVAESAALEERLTRSLKEVERLRESLFQKYEGAMLDLSAEIARQVAGEAAAKDLAVFKRVAATALSKSPEGLDATVHLSSEDYRRLTETDQEELRTNSTAGSVSFSPDDQIEPGGCRIETKYGEIDAQIEGMVTEIRRTLDDQLRRGRPASGAQS